ncbi:MAG: hypothetical protein H7Y30_00985 [Pyrinomonadaceae bacterium]|nr:hypothetical protein [Pyrinomonadaceae bacterium]
MEIAIHKLAVISFFIIGLSHVIQPRVWVQFFIEVRNKGEAGSFINAFIHFPLGVLIVSFHNVWHGLPVILTLMGWGWVLKGLIYFIFPRWGLKTMARVSMKKSWEFVAAGLIFLALDGVLIYSLFSRQ